MAITRGATTNAENASAASVSITKPTCSVGDVLIASSSTAASNAAPTLSGTWTVISNYAISTLYNISMWYRVVDGTEAASFTLTQSAAARISGQITVYSGVDTATPMDLAATYIQATANATTLAHPGVTTRTNGAMVIMAGGNDSSTNTNLTNPAGTTQIWENTSSVGKDHLFAEELIATAGATGTRTWTGGASALNMGAIHAALKPSSGAPAAQTVNPTGLATVEAFGTTVVSLSGAPQSVSATGIVSVESSGSPTVTGGSTGPVGTVVNRWVGACTTTGASVVVKVTQGTNVRLKVSTASDLSVSPVFSNTFTPDAQSVAKCSITGLTANTQYYYGVEIGGTVDTTKIGKFKTAPSGQSSFTFATASCCNVDSDSWTRAMARNPDMIVHTGDLGYWDTTTNSVATFRTNYDSVMSRTNQEAAFAKANVVYTWSDHDFGGNNALGTSASKPAVQQVYRERVPFYPLEVNNTSTGTGEIYHTFMWGRVQFIVTDERSNKGVVSGEVLGSTQKTWFKNQITNSTAPLIIWVGDTPWIGTAASGDDEYFGTTWRAEHDELENHIAASGKNVVRVAGDMHAVATSDGSSSQGMIVLQAAPWNQTFSNKGGPYTSGPYPTSGAVVNQYGFVQITDNGSSIVLQFNGYDDTDISRVSLTKTYSTGPQTVNPTGITSAQTFGATTAINKLQNVSPSGISSLEAFGTAFPSTVGSVVAHTYTESEYRAKFSEGYTRITRRVEILNSDGTTLWDDKVGNLSRLISGSISVDYDRDERRSLDLELANFDNALVHKPGGFWYDKILKPYRGIEFYDSTGLQSYEVSLGLFMIDRVARSNSPKTVKVTARDLTKKLLLSKFTQSTGFAGTTLVTDVIHTLAGNAGIAASRRIIASSSATLGVDTVWDRGTSRWEAIKAVATAAGFEVFFDADGYLRTRTFIDPTTAPVMHDFLTGPSVGNIVTWDKSADDNRIFNHISVIGATSDADVIPVWADSYNNDPNSPTRIALLGDRVDTYESALVTTQQQAQDLADLWLKTAALEEYSVDFSAIVYPWLEVGEVVRFTDPDAGPNEPNKFLLTSLTIPMGLEPMSATARRITIVG